MKFLQSKSTPVIFNWWLGFIMLVLLSGIATTLMAQAHTAKAGDLERFKEMKTRPEDFTPTQRVEIYNQHIGPYYRTSMDTVKFMFREMAAFGKDIQDEYVIGSALSALAELNRMEGRYQQAIPLFKDALKYVEEYPYNVHGILGALSNVYMLVDQLDSAEIYADMSLQLVLELQDSTGYTSAYLQKGVILSHQEKYYSALEQFFLALAFADAADVPLRKANTYGLIANCYQAVRDRDNAIAYAKLALSIAQEKKYARMASEMHEQLGIYYLDQDSLALAESSFIAALVGIGKNENAKSRIILNSNLAILASRRNEIKSAERYLAEASHFLQADISDMIKANYYQAAGKVALSKGQWTQGIKAYNQVVQMGKEVGNEQIRLNGYTGLNEAYRRSGDYKTALWYGDSLADLHHTLDLAFQKRTMLDLSQKYETNIKNGEIAKLSALQIVNELELTQKHKQLMFSLIGLFLAIAALAGFVFALVTKSRSHKVLHDKNTQLREALENNKMLIKEIHHRVKNNLQVVSSLLNLQSRFETDGTVMRAINTSKNRVQSMSLLHQHLYLNEDLNSIRVKNYFEDLSHFLVKGYPLHGKEVMLELDVEDISLDVDTVVPMGLICNELITNALKYAYPKTMQGVLLVSIKEAHGKIRLIVKDNGVGTSFTQLPEKSTSMGTQLIKSFANKLKATIEIDNFEGTEFKLTFERKAPIQTFKALENVAG